MQLIASASDCWSLGLRRTMRLLSPGIHCCRNSFGVYPRVRKGLVPQVCFGWLPCAVAGSALLVFSWVICNMQLLVCLKGLQFKQFDRPNEVRLSFLTVALQWTRFPSVSGWYTDGTLVPFALNKGHSYIHFYNSWNPHLMWCGSKQFPHGLLSHVFLLNMKWRNKIWD